MSKLIQYYLLNGTVYEELPKKFAAENRAFRLGDGFFETIRIRNGDIPYWDAHYARIKASARALSLEIPDLYSSELMQKSLKNLILKNQIENGGILRILFFREGQGTYMPTSNRIGFLAETKTFRHNDFVMNDSGLSVGIYRELYKRTDKFSRYKVLGNQIYIQAAIWAQKSGFDDALVLNESERIIEGSSSNLFLIKKGELHTPSLDDGCLAGVMRMIIINAALEMSIPVFESEIDENDLLDAEEVFLTNAIKGISWIGSYQSKRYFHSISNKILEHLNQDVPIIN